MAFCRHCLAALPFNRHACPRCAAPLPPQTPSGSLCGECTGNPPPFLRGFAALRYEAPVGHLIGRLKFQGQLHLVEPLARLLIEEIGELRKAPDLLVPIPLHPRRLRERGFNQSLELARVLARHYGLRLDGRLCRRTRATPPQSGLKREQRGKNLRGAFTVAGDPRGLRVALLDDVITTGATVSALGKALLRAGAAEIEVWTLARTPDR